MVSANFALTPNLASTMEWTILGLGNARGNLHGTFTVKNNGLQAIKLKVFDYLDLDLGGTRGDDIAGQEEQGKPKFLIGDPNWAARYQGIQTGFTNFGSDAFPIIRNLLTNNAADDFPSMEPMLFPGDWTGGFEWEQTINAGQSARFSAVVEIFPRPVPEPGISWLLALALAAMVLAPVRRGQPIHGS